MDVSRSGTVVHFVYEILDSLISQVTAPEDAAAEEEGEREGEERADPTALLLSGASESLVVSLAYKATRVHVYQPRVARQRHGHFCGHFALHFAHCAQQLTRSTSRGVARRALARASSRVAQWRRYISQPVCLKLRLHRLSLCLLGRPTLGKRGEGGYSGPTVRTLSHRC